MKIRIALAASLAAAVLAVGPEAASAQDAPTIEAELATAVVDRMPEGAGSQFPADVGEVFLWMRVTGAADQTLQHVWMHDGNEYPVELNIGGSPWRTWSSKTIPPEWSGEWQVEIRDAQGNLLEAMSFTVG